MMRSRNGSGTKVVTDFDVQKFGRLKSKRNQKVGLTVVDVSKFRGSIRHISDIPGLS